MKISHFKKYKKAYLLGTAGVVAIVGVGLALSWNCIQSNIIAKKKKYALVPHKNYLLLKRKLLLS